jgi:hypothetical protein
MAEKGDFSAHMPRICLHFGGAAAAGAAAAAVEPCAPELSALVLALSLEVDGEALTPASCYMAGTERAAGWAAHAPGLTAANCVVVTCTDGSGATVETVVNVAEGGSVIKCPSPLNVRKDTYDHSCY